MKGQQMSNGQRKRDGSKLAVLAMSAKVEESDILMPEYRKKQGQ